MNLLSKLFAAIRGNVNNVGEAIVDSQSMVILDQQMRDVRAALEKSRQQHTTILAKKKVAEQTVAQLRGDVEKYENKAAQLASTNEALALETMEHVLTLKSKLDAEVSMLDSYTASEKTIAAAVKKCTDELRRMEQQIDQVKANDSVIKAQTVASQALDSGSGNIKTAKDHLASIQEKQRLRTAELQAASEVADKDSGVALDEKLAAAERPASAKDALAQLLASKQSASV